MSVLHEVQAVQHDLADTPGFSEVRVVASLGPRVVEEEPWRDPRGAREMQLAL